MSLYAVAEEADDFLREFTRRGAKVSISGLIIVSPPLALVGRLLGLAGRRPRWRQFPLGRPEGQYGSRSWPVFSGSVSLQVFAPEVMEARGDLVSCAVLLAVARYDATPRGRCPERLRALASVVLVEGHAVLTSPKGP